MNPFGAKIGKTNYNVVPYGDHGTERVKLGYIQAEHAAAIISDMSIVSLLF
jgi:hypothetical protein